MQPHEDFLSGVCQTPPPNPVFWQPALKFRKTLYAYSKNFVTVCYDNCTNWWKTVFWCTPANWGKTLEMGHNRLY